MRRGGGGRKASSHSDQQYHQQQQQLQQQLQHQQQQGYDVHHNNDSPCCRMLYNVARQIIPLSPSSSSNEVEDGDAEIVLPPLLAKMLQEHLLQEHEAIILASTSSLSEQGKVSASKKKKKKKKKKKPTTDQPLEEEEAMIIPLEEQGNEDDDVDANATTTSTTATSNITTTVNAAPTVVTPNDKKKKSKDHHHQQQQKRQQDPSPSSGDEILMLKPSSSTIDANIDTPTSMLPVNKRIMNPWLQDFLTTFRQSMDENEHQQQQVPPPTTPTRNLQDFLDFLSRTSSSQHPKNTKSSSSSSSSSSSLSSYHVTLHQVQEHAIRPVDCPCCTSVLQRYFQHATTIPLLPSLNAIYEKQERLLLQSNNSNSRRRRPQYYSNRAAADPQHHYQHLHNVNTSSTASLFGLDDDDNDDYDNYNQYHRNYHHNRSRSDSSGDNNDQHAFDYVAMEEGILQQELDDDESNLNNNNDTLSTTPCLAFVKVSADQKQSGWQLRRMDHDIHNNHNGSSASSYSSSSPMMNWTMDDLNFVLQEYILMGGLGHDELVAATSTCCNRRLLSDEQFIDIVESVQVRYSKVLEELTQCISEILRHETTLKELTTSSNGGGFGGFGDVAGGGGGAIVGNIDMTGPTTMMDIDSNVCTVLGRLLQIVLNVTESYQTIGLYLNRTSTNSSSSNHKLPRHVPHLLTNDSVIMSMWQVYLKAFGDIVANTLTFEQKLFSIADRHGKINPFFYSGTARQFLYELVQNKVRIVVYAVDSIKRHLDDRLDVVETAICTYRPTFMRSIFTYEAFLAMIGATNNGEEQRAKSSPLDQACTDVLFEMREWSETVQESSIANILDKHRARRDRLFRLLQIAQKQFQTDMETVKSSDTSDTRLPGNQVLQSMGQPLTALLEKYSETSPGNNSDDDQRGSNSQEALSALRGQLPCTMLSSIKLWLSLSVNPVGQNGGQASPTAAMPLKLVQFLIARAKEDFDPTSCRGPDGTVRAALAMTALFCRWLSDRFHEWHAELVQQELLTAMEDEHQQPAQTSAASSTTTVKSAKKSKKKKAKISLATVSSSSLSENMASKDQSVAGGGNDTRSTNGSKIPTNGDTAAADVQGKSKAVIAPTNGDAAAAASVAALDSHEKQEAGDASTTQLDPETKDAMRSSLPPQQPDVDVSHLASKTSITAPIDNSNCGSNKGVNDAAKEQPNGNTPPGQEGNSYSGSDVALMDVDPFVTIGVHDRSSFMSAESYLVGRLLQVTTSGDEGQRNVTIL